MSCFCQLVLKVFKYLFCDPEKLCMMLHLRLAYEMPRVYPGSLQILYEYHVTLSLYDAFSCSSSLFCLTESTATKKKVQAGFLQTV